MGTLELIRKIRKEQKWDINISVFYRWKKRGIVKDASKKRMYIGKYVPDYTEEDYQEIIERLKKASKEGKIRLQAMID